MPEALIPAGRQQLRALPRQRLLPPRMLQAERQVPALEFQHPPRLT